MQDECSDKEEKRWEPWYREETQHKLVKARENKDNMRGSPRCQSQENWPKNHKYQVKGLNQKDYWG